MNTWQKFLNLASLRKFANTYGLLELPLCTLASQDIASNDALISNATFSTRNEHPTVTMSRVAKTH
jgi:hypothetical protein